MEIFLKTGKHPWTARGLCRLLITHWDGASINQTEAMKFSNVHNRLSVLVQKDFCLVHKFEALVNFDISFELECSTWLVHVRIKDILVRRCRPSTCCQVRSRLMFGIIRSPSSVWRTESRSSSWVVKWLCLQLKKHWYLSYWELFSVQFEEQWSKTVVRSSRLLPKEQNYRH